MRKLGILLVLLGPAFAEKPVARWGYDLETALAEAKKTGRQVLVYVLDTV